MSHWVCEDVGLVVNELREQFSERLNYYEDIIEKDGTCEQFEGIIKGLNIAYDILDEVADRWTSDELPEDVVNKLKEKYGGLT